MSAAVMLLGVFGLGACVKDPTESPSLDAAAGADVGITASDALVDSGAVDAAARRDRGHEDAQGDATGTHDAGVDAGVDTGVDAGYPCDVFGEWAFEEEVFPRHKELIIAPGPRGTVSARFRAQSFEPRCLACPLEDRLDSARLSRDCVLESTHRYAYLDVDTCDSDIFLSLEIRFDAARGVGRGVHQYISNNQTNHWSDCADPYHSPRRLVTLHRVDR